MANGREIDGGEDLISQNWEWYRIQLGCRCGDMNIFKTLKVRKHLGAGAKRFFR